METPSFTEHSVPQGQGNLYVRDYPGAGPAFVLMHGFPDNSLIYTDLIPHLVAEGRRVVTFDFLGFGASDKPAGATYSFAQQVGDLLAVVQALELGKIVPVGHDSSGPAALNFALDYPAHVASVCLLNCIYAQFPTLRLPEFIELFATQNLRPLTQALLQSPEQFGWVLNFARTAFLKGLTNAQKQRIGELLSPLTDTNFRQQPSAGPAFAAMTYQAFDELARNTRRLFEVETLPFAVTLIWGETDPYLHPQGALELQRHLPHAALHLLPAGHWLMINTPAEVAQLLLAA